jgi:hypothetical protein
MNCRDPVGITDPGLDSRSLKLFCALGFSGCSTDSVPICLQQLRQLNPSAPASDYDNSCHRLSLLACFTGRSAGAQTGKRLTNLFIVFNLKGGTALLNLPS